MGIFFIFEKLTHSKPAPVEKLLGQNYGEMEDESVNQRLLR